jgi:hypothetical protein
MDGWSTRESVWADAIMLGCAQDDELTTDTQRQKGRADLTRYRGRMEGVRMGIPRGSPEERRIFRIQS